MAFGKSKKKTEGEKELDAIVESGTAPNGEPITADTTSNAEEASSTPGLDAEGNAKSDSPPKAPAEEPTSKSKKPALSPEEKAERAAARKAEKAALKALAADAEEVVEAVQVSTYEKEFVIPAIDYFAASHDHAAAIAFTTREALGSGWKTTEAPKFVGATEIAGRRPSVSLRYEVPVVPAS